MDHRGAFRGVSGFYSRGKLDADRADSFDSVLEGTARFNSGDNDNPHRAAILVLRFVESGWRLARLLQSAPAISRLAAGTESGARTLFAGIGVEGHGFAAVGSRCCRT